MYRLLRHVFRSADVHGVHPVHPVRAEPLQHGPLAAEGTAGRESHTGATRR